MNSKNTMLKKSALFLAIIFMVFAISPIDASPKKKKKDKYDYITLTVFQQFSKDMAYMNLKSGAQGKSPQENNRSMVNISFEGDENSKELQQRFFEQYGKQPSLPLALDFLGDSGWEVSTTTQILVDGGLLMTTVVLQKAK